MVSENKLDAIILVELIAHHTPNLTSFDSTSWNFLQIITFYSEEMKQSYVAKLSECRGYFTAVPLMMVPVHKIKLDVRLHVHGYVHHQ
jgi:hypothetical protein